MAIYTNRDSVLDDKKGCIVSRGIPISGVTPEMLRWARESAHLTIEDVAGRLRKPPDLIDAWETGDDAPTYAQLERLAYELYHRPLALFFLPEPPFEPKPEAEFRALPDADLQALSRDTVLLIRKAHCYQSSLKELFGNKSPSELPIWKSLALDAKKAVRPQAREVREALSVPPPGAIEWGSADGDKALKVWRRSIEDKGVFVFKDTFKQNSISGFCLEDNELPIMLINNSTAKTRQIFSVIHELTHILLQMRAISSTDEQTLHRLPPREQNIELFCNKVASEVLVPHDDLVRQISTLQPNAEDWPDDVYATLAARYPVSRAVILRRMLDEGRVSQNFYIERTEVWDGQYTGNARSGGNFYLTTRAYLSERLMSEVFSRYQRRLITIDEAANLIGVKPKHMGELENRFVEGFAP